MNTNDNELHGIDLTLQEWALALRSWNDEPGTDRVRALSTRAPLGATPMMYVLLGLGILIVGFIWWRFISVGRGARQRDDRILELVEPIGEKLADGEEVSAREVAELARLPQTRPFLYEMLKHFEKIDLFPDQYKDLKSQGEAQLAYWMMHPNELQDPPEQIELIETCPREIDGKESDFLVFRYKMEHGHWAGDEWLLGLSGPFFRNDVPYSGIASAFSRCDDRYGEIQAAELVDWFIDMVKAKNA
jgi:hypothetical protein